MASILYRRLKLCGILFTNLHIVAFICLPFSLHVCIGQYRFDEAHQMNKKQC